MSDFDDLFQSYNPDLFPSEEDPLSEFDLLFGLQSGLDPVSAEEQWRTRQLLSQRRPGESKEDRDRRMLTHMQARQQELDSAASPEPVRQGFDRFAHNLADGLDLGRAALLDGAAGPLVGLAERASLVPDGTRQVVREEFEGKRDEFLTESPTLGRASVAFATELLANTVPVVPAGVAGKVAGKVLPRVAPKVFNAGSRAGRIASGALAGAAEGALTGFGDTAGLDAAGQGIGIGLGTLLGAGGGALGARSPKKNAQSTTSSDEIVEGFRSRYFSDGEKPSTLKTAARKFYTEVVDSFSSLDRVARRDSDEAADSLAPLIQRVRTESVLATSPVFRGTTRMSDITGEIEVTGGSLNDILKGLDQPSYRDAEALLAAYRQTEDIATRAAAGGKITANPEATAQSVSLVKHLEGKYGVDAETGRINQLDDVVDQYREWTKRAFLDPLEEVGVLSPDQKSTILGQNEHYAIFRRAQDFLERSGIELTPEDAATRRRGTPGKSSPVKGIRGGLDSEGKIGNIFEDSAIQSMRISKFVGRQRVRNFMARLADENADLGNEIVRAPTVPKFAAAVELEEVVSNSRIADAALEGTGLERKRFQRFLRLQEREPFAALASPEARVFAGPMEKYQKLIAEREGLAELLPEGGQAITRNAQKEVDSFTVWRNGEREFYHATPELQKAMEGLTPKQSFMLMKPLQYLTRLQRAGATLGPEFIVRNPLRDQVTAGINSRHGYIPFWDFGRGIFSMVKRGELWDDFLNSGATGSTLVSLDRPGIRDDLARESGIGSRSAVTRYLREVADSKGLKPLQDASDFFETATRLTEFELSRKGGRKTVLGLGIPGTLGKSGKKGATIPQAGLDASEVTLNFSRAGGFGRFWNSIEAFSNAEIQDADKFARNMKERPLETTVKALAYVTVPSIIHWSKWKDDEEYRALPEWDRSLFFHLGRTEEGGFIRIPRPLGVASVIFGAMTERSLSYLNDADPKAAQEMVEAFTEQTPLHFLSQPEDLIPSAIEPLAEARANFDNFRERAIVPLSESRIDPAFQGQETTGPTAKLLAKAARSPAGQALGIKRATRGGSPLVVQHLLRGYFSSVGRLAEDATDSLLSRGQPQGPVHQSHSLSDVPVVRAFVSRAPIGFSSGPVGDLYSLAAKAETARATLNRLEASKSLDEYLEYSRNHPEAALFTPLQGVKRELASLRSMRAAVANDKRLSKEQAREQLLKIDQLATQLAANSMMAATEILVDP